MVGLAISDGGYVLGLEILVLDIVGEEVLVEDFILFLVGFGLRLVLLLVIEEVQVVLVRVGVVRDHVLAILGGSGGRDPGAVVVEVFDFQLVALGGLLVLVEVIFPGLISFESIIGVYDYLFLLV